MFIYLLRTMLIGDDMRKIKFGIIGIGGIGKHHAKCMRQVDEIELKAIADINEEIARKIAEEYKVKWYTDYLLMLEKEDIDAVSICTPHYLHAKMAIDCMKFGKHVLVEKPMARTVAECDSMIKEARKRGLKLGVVFQKRTNPDIIAAKEFVMKGELGELYRASLEFFTFRSQAYYNSGAWRGTWSMEGGGVLINQGVHFIDIFQWIINLKPKRLMAIIGNLLHNIEVEDLASAILEFENDVQATMQFSTIDYPGYRRMVFRGDKSILIYEDGKVRVAYTKPGIRLGIQESEIWGAPKCEWEELKIEEREHGHVAVLRDFARAILEDREPMVTGEEGIKSVEIINAIIMSGVTGKVVTFPIDREAYDKVINKLSKLKRIEYFQI